MTGAVATEDPEFAALTERDRRELHVHCYRMLASFDEAEDAVQETFLRAWRSRDRLDDSTFLRAYLYRIATIVCLDTLRRTSRRLTAMNFFAEVPWLQPYPDRLLDEIAPSDEQPDAIVVERETIELAFLAALQVLPPRQRAALILRDVLGWPARETASLLETTVSAANSALQRARETMHAHLSARRAEWSAREPSAQERALLDRFIDAHERCDAKAAVAIAAEDLRITMPPNPSLFEGSDAVAPLLERAFGENRDGDWRLLPTQANRMPAAASYLRRPGDSEFRGFKLDVLRVVDGSVAEITTFGYALFPAVRAAARALRNTYAPPFLDGGARMPKGYMVFVETVHDQKAYDGYAQKAFPTLLQYGGKVLVAVDESEVVEGSWPGPKTIVLEFESVEAARTWYYSPEYQAVIGGRQASTEATGALMVGFEMPGG